MKRVAVLAVHGVADQQPEASARAVADLLLGPQVGHRYYGFQEEDLRIALSRVEVAQRVDEAKAGRGMLSQGSATLEYLKRGQAIELEGTDGTPQADAVQRGGRLDLAAAEHYAMREQLQDFEATPGDDALDTVVVRGFRRQAEGGEAECGVDVFEMYWADLSRLKSSLLSVFFEFYLLLFFLTRIGGITLASAAAHFRENARQWVLLTSVHEWAERALALVIPILILCLLSLCVAATLYFLPTQAPLAILFALVPGVITALLIGHLLYRYRFQVPGRLWPPLFAVALLASGGASAVALASGIGYRGFVFWLWLVAAALLLWLCYIYERRRRGAWPLGLLLFAITLGLYAGQLWWAGNDDSRGGVYYATLATARWLSYGITVAWGFFIVMSILTSVLGALINLTAPAHQQYIVRRSIWTANLSLVLPGLLVLILNIGLWRALAALAEHTGHIPDTEMGLILALIDSYTPVGMGFGIALLAVVTLLAVWSISPSVLVELQGDSGNVQRSRWLGESLSAGFRWMRLSGEAFRWLIVLGVPASFALAWWFGWTRSDADRYAALGTGLLALLIVTGSHGPFKFLALGFRSALDIALDVANWLRSTPKRATPRATICRRYVSLLRQIANWRDPRDGSGYSALIIVAHSQGTVITADLLRFLTREYGSAAQSPDTSLSCLFQLDPDRHLPIYLFTMGSPLRQLYSLRFPLQYGWAGTDTTLGALPGPDPATLTVTRWSNAYCSGDYVGRHLWRADDDPHLWDTTWHNLDTVRREVCLGAGAHTHYWDGTVPEVAAELDRLIAEACRLAA